MSPTLPPLQDRWITELLGASLPGEPRSTCASCAMVEGPPPDPGPHFLADVKCCTFVPNLPNFIVGRILRDPDSAAGHTSVRARLAAGQGVTPLGVQITPELASAHAEARKNGEFGRRRDLLCPHWLDAGGGTCSIWRHRESVCSTWFCHHSRGATSAQLWLTLRRLLHHLEGALARWALLQIDPERKDNAWGPWVDRKEDLYARCAELVEVLSWKEARRIGGLEVRMRGQMLIEAWAELQRPTVPPQVDPGLPRTEPLTDGRVRTWTWSRYDPLDVPAAVLEVLPRFAGRPTEEVYAELAASALLTEDLLQSLADWRLLALPPDEA